MKNNKYQNTLIEGSRIDISITIGIIPLLMDNHFLIMRTNLTIRYTRTVHLIMDKITIQFCKNGSK